MNGNSVLQITRSNTIATMASNNKDCMKKNSNKDWRWLVIIHLESTINKNWRRETLKLFPYSIPIELQSQVKK